MNTRTEREIQHGEYLAAADTEALWGWGTPAGRIRAKRRTELIVNRAGLGALSKVLEIGCGTGMFTEMFACTGARITAVDISPALIAKAVARNLPREKVSFLAQRFEDCDVLGPFDAVIGSSVLHHLDVGTSLRKIHALLRPGGVMSFAEPNMLNPQVFVERKCRKFFLYVSPNETAFVRWSLSTMLREAGFIDVDVTPFDWLHPRVPRRLVDIVVAMGRGMEAVPLLREFAGSLSIVARRAS